MAGIIERGKRSITRRLRFRDKTPWPLHPATLGRDTVQLDDGHTTALAALNGHPTLSGDELLSMMRELPGVLALSQSHVRSRLPLPITAFARSTMAIRDLRPLMPYNQRTQELPFLLEASSSAPISLIVSYLDRDGVELSRSLRAAGDGTPVPVPADALHLRIGLRIPAGTSAHIHRLAFGHRAGGLDSFPVKSPIMLLSNGYPADDDLYRNAFLHARVSGYRRLGQVVDVVVYRRGEPDSSRRFDGIDIVTVSDESLPLALAAHGHAFVHFLNRAMWNALEPCLDAMHVTVWVHGYEIQPWTRRAFAFTTDAERASAQAASVEREALWSEVLRTEHQNLSFVFVSQTLRRMVEEDYHLTLDHSRCRVIHNPIDVEQFAFIPKDPEQRLRVLSIRPFASRVYANDLTIEAILALAQEPEFASMRFRIVGDGPLFDETVAPLRVFPNVQLDQHFINAEQIAALHREYGIFLCPSRMDSQGVSRDEAMASGLVPVTSAVAAIPEFVDDACGILAAPESSDELAAGILRLVREPETFTRLSAAAAARVRADRAADAVLRAELALAARPGTVA
jgi:glycosyltransferase involved in cell wall biosynthesis